MLQKQMKIVLRWLCWCNWPHYMRLCGLQDNPDLSSSTKTHPCILLLSTASTKFWLRKVEKVRILQDHVYHWLVLTKKVPALQITSVYLIEYHCCLKFSNLAAWDICQDNEVVLDRKYYLEILTESKRCYSVSLASWWLYFHTLTI